MSSNKDPLQCPVCKKYLSAPIRQCEEGHNFCEVCIENESSCPTCDSLILPNRNKILEKMIVDAKYPCKFESKGCKYVISLNVKAEHEDECFFRSFKCEGKLFCNWKCSWKGNYDQIKNHFENEHKNQMSLNFKGNIKIEYPTKNYTQLQLIPAHYQLFWYKNRIDMSLNRAYWLFQFIGPKKQASYFYYELEFFQEDNPIRKLKVTELCESDICNANEIFKTEKCVAVSLEALNTFRDKNNEIAFRYWIHKIPKPSENKPVQDVKSTDSIKHSSEDKKPQQVNNVPQYFNPMGAIPKQRFTAVPLMQIPMMRPPIQVPLQMPPIRMPDIQQPHHSFPRTVPNGENCSNDRRPRFRSSSQGRKPRRKQN